MCASCCCRTQLPPPFHPPQRKQQLESQRDVIIARMAELEGAQRAAEAAMAPLQEQIDALQLEKNRLNQEQRTKADA